MQDVCVKIVKVSSAGSWRNTCAKILHKDLSCKISASRSSPRDPAGALAQDLCVSISVRCLSRSPGHDPVRAIVQERCVRISCARCLRQGLLSRIL